MNKSDELILVSSEDRNTPDYLILGGSGFLGSEFVKYLAKSNSVCATYHGNFPFSIPGVSWFNFNVSDFNVRELISFIRPKIIINCIALADVDLCELQPSKANELNHEFPKFLAYVCSQLGIYLVHISTDHYDSIARLPRKESDYVFGVNQYGISKFKGETAIQNSNPAALILRTNFFHFSNSYAKSFLNWVIRNLENKINIPGYTDIEFSPVSIHELIKCTSSLIEINAHGIINVSSTESITKYNFMRLVARVYDCDLNLIEPKVSIKVKNRVKRPQFMSLDNSRLTCELGQKITDLESMIQQLKGI